MAEEKYLEEQENNGEGSSSESNSDDEPTMFRLDEDSNLDNKQSLEKNSPNETTTESEEKLEENQNNLNDRVSSNPVLIKKNPESTKNSTSLPISFYSKKNSVNGLDDEDGTNDLDELNKFRRQQRMQYDPESRASWGRIK